jgi:hypothetical protein
LAAVSSVTNFRIAKSPSGDQTWPDQTLSVEVIARAGPESTQFIEHFTAHARGKLNRAGDAGGATWTVHDARLDKADGNGFRLGEHVMQPDQFVSVRDDEGAMQAVRVSDVKPTGEVLK